MRLVLILAGLGAALLLGGAANAPILAFNRIQPGWTRADVEREFGPPAVIEAVASWSGPIMTYRWRDRVGTDMFFFVYLDPQGIVRRAHPGIEYRNAPDRQ